MKEEREEIGWGEDMAMGDGSWGLGKGEMEELGLFGVEGG